jgi:hypothetical protein
MAQRPSGQVIGNKEVLWIGAGMLFGAALLGYLLIWRALW